MDGGGRLSLISLQMGQVVLNLVSNSSSHGTVCPLGTW